MTYRNASIDVGGPPLGSELDQAAFAAAARENCGQIDRFGNERARDGNDRLLDELFEPIDDGGELAAVPAVQAGAEDLGNLVGYSIWLMA
jgi:hypothetical protein